MTEFWKADLPALYADLGIAATWTDSCGPHPVTVIFDDPFEPTEMQESRFATSSPSARLVLADAKTIAADDTLTVTRNNVATIYQILEVQPDSYGEVHLRLSEDAG